MIPKTAGERTDVSFALSPVFDLFVSGARQQHMVSEEERDAWV